MIHPQDNWTDDAQWSSSESSTFNSSVNVVGEEGGVCGRASEVWVGGGVECEECAVVLEREVLDSEVDGGDIVGV